MLDACRGSEKPVRTIRSKYYERGVMFTGIVTDVGEVRVGASRSAEGLHAAARSPAPTTPKTIVDGRLDRLRRACA